MPTLACLHQEADHACRVCLHLLVKQIDGYCKWFIGSGTDYDLAYMLVGYDNGRAAAV
jgi:hypothetical protein